MAAEASKFVSFEKLITTMEKFVVGRNGIEMAMRKSRTAEMINKKDAAAAIWSGVCVVCVLVGDSIGGDDGTYLNHLVHSPFKILGPLRLLRPYRNRSRPTSSLATVPSMCHPYWVRLLG